MFLLWFFIFLKHFICDFPLQGPYQFLNKGKYGHPGGILHASIHFFGMMLICIVFRLPVWLAIVDGVVHYNIDYVKARFNAHFNLKPENPQFWNLFSLDQFLHMLTYLFILYIAGLL